jgi:anaerobic ribonucleoside-triphosphate reductase activating protein
MCAWPEYSQRSSTSACAAPPVATVRINKAHYPVTVLGYGKRIGIWFQGCAIHCRGCLAQDTWDTGGGCAITVDALLDWCQEKLIDGADGVTLSGGEPFNQSDSLSALLDGLHRLRAETSMTFDLLAYSGYPLRMLNTRYDKILLKLDAVIPEPYIEALPEGGCWRGSDNQPLVPLSPLGKARYETGEHETTVDDRRCLPKKLQLAVSGNRIWMIGIPGRHDMDELARLCDGRGLQLGAVSWREK